MERRKDQTTLEGYEESASTKPKRKTPKQENASLLRLPNISRMWDEPASQRQRAWLNDLGIDIPDNTTRLEASQIIQERTGRE